MGFAPVDERICCLRVRGKFFSTTLICTHAPPKEEDETEKKSLYDKLDRVYQKASKYNIKTVKGDMNTKLRKIREDPQCMHTQLHEE
jgi:hypothetical protein